MLKQKKLFEYALRALLRKKRKFFALLLIYALVVAFYASIVFFTSSLSKETQEVLKDMPELWIQKVAGGRLVPMPVSMLDSLQNIRGVKRIIPRVWGYNYDTPTGAVFTIVGTDSTLSGLKMLKTSHIQKLKDNMAIVGTGFLELRGLELGERLTLLDPKGEIRSYQIVGKFESVSDLLTRDLILLSPNAAKQMLGLKKDELTDVALEIYNPLEIDNIGRKIDRRFSGVRVVTNIQLGSTYQALFGWRGGIFVYGTLLALFAFLILAWERASGLGREEKNELAVLKAVGWQINDVLMMKFWEAFAVSITATISGIFLAFLHVFIFQAPLLKPFLIGWSVLYPDYQLFPVLEIESILVIFSLSVIPYLSATLIPAWRGAITNPAEVMQA